MINYLNSDLKAQQEIKKLRQELLAAQKELKKTQRQLNKARKQKKVLITRLAKQNDKANPKSPLASASHFSFWKKSPND